MRRFSSLGGGPDDAGDSPLERLISTAKSITGRLIGGRPQQALPMSSYRGQNGPVVPYQERRSQMMRSRRRQHGPYTLIFVVVALVLVLGLFYGLSWALGGVSQGSGAKATPTVPRTTPAAAVSPSPSVPAVVLPTAGPGAAAPSPSPLPGAVAPIPAPAATSATPDGRTYTVKVGDTPAQIARQFGVSADALMRANNITDARALKVGDRLTIPPATTATTGG
jgi:LysM repeat protein